MRINERDYPYLLTERTWSWGPVTTIFERENPPHELVSNVSMAPFDSSGWLVVETSQDGESSAEPWNLVKPTSTH